MKAVLRFAEVSQQKTYVPGMFPQSPAPTCHWAHSVGTSAREGVSQHSESFRQVRLNLEHNVPTNFKNPQDIPVLVLRSLCFLPERQLSLITTFSSWDKKVQKSPCCYVCVCPPLQVKRKAVFWYQHFIYWPRVCKANTAQPMSVLMDQRDA